MGQSGVLGKNIVLSIYLMLKLIILLDLWLPWSSEIVW